MDLNLQGSRALITGASKGIGAATAEALAEEGCELVIVARDASGLDALAGKLQKLHGVKIQTYPGDLRSIDFCDKLAVDVGDVDILVNNAGDIPLGTIEDIDETTWRHAWDLKVFGYINLTRSFYSKMKQRRKGVIINNIGVAGEWFDGSYIAGSTGNAALMAFTRSLGGQSFVNNVRVVGINPGPVATDRLLAMLERQSADKIAAGGNPAELFSKLPNGRAASQREIADMIAFLASERSGYTSGVVVTIDGGLGARGR